MKLATSELRQRIYELGMDLQGPYAAVVDPERAEERGPLAARRGRSAWPPPSAGGPRRSSATSSPAQVLGLPKGVRRPWTSPSPTSRRCCGTPPPPCSTGSSRPTLVRAAVYDPTEDGPALARAAFDTHLRDWFALGDDARRGPVPVPRGVRRRGGAPVPCGPRASLALPVLRAAGHAGGATPWRRARSPPRWPWRARDGQWVANGESDQVLRARRGVGRPAGRGHGGPARVRGPRRGHGLRARRRRRGPPRGGHPRPLPAAVRGDAPVGRSGGAGRARRRFGGALQRATVALAAELVGGGRWLREVTVAYVRRARAVRPARGLLPGPAVEAGRCRAGARAGRGRGGLRRHVPRRGGPGPSPTRCTWPRPRRAAARALGHRRPAGARRHRLHVGARPAPAAPSCLRPPTTSSATPTGTATDLADLIFRGPPTPDRPDPGAGPAGARPGPRPTQKPHRQQTQQEGDAMTRTPTARVSLDNRVVIITGAGGGLGRCHALLMAGARGPGGGQRPRAAPRSGEGCRRDRGGQGGGGDRGRRRRGGGQPRLGRPRPRAARRSCRPRSTPSGRWTWWSTTPASCATSRSPR